MRLEQPLNEQARWLDQLQEDRGLSPDRQMRQPFGFRSKRQYRQESVNGYQDVRMQEKRKDQNFQYLIEVFGENEDGYADGYLLSGSPDQIEKIFKDVARLDAEIASWSQDQHE